ncbi:MAG: hypothetical protein K9H61_13490 [Bacteroidia bacterium]|nr:hypothetical protein [Bacteroidia bacterium]MCF8425190.1 hypothetical protein [Bacteroidia bacterium]MCF8447997.1 hypothetical protein [Bacteroidia bacterium]
MTTQKINSVKQTIGFFSMTIAWTLMNILNSIYLVSEDGKADDSGVIIFWSGLFITIAWAVFIIWPISRLDHSKKLFKPKLFIPVSTVYGALTYSIIAGGIFRSIELVTMFLPQAILVGLFFGLAYSLLIKQEKIIDLLNQRPITKTIFFLSPAIILGFFLWFLPLVAPNLVYRFMTDEIRQKIVARTIPKFKVGDEIEPLKKALPGYLDHIENGSGNMSASMENFAFVIQVNCGKIIRLEYGQSQFDIDGTIYGKLQEKPCP